MRKVLKPALTPSVTGEESGYPGRPTRPERERRRFAVLATNALKDACGFTNPIQQLTKKLWRFIAQRCNHHFHTAGKLSAAFSTISVTLARKF